jgi:ribonuclease E
MTDENVNSQNSDSETPAAKRPRRAASRPAGPPAGDKPTQEPKAKAAKPPVKKARGGNKSSKPESANTQSDAGSDTTAPAVPLSAVFQAPDVVKGEAAAPRERTKPAQGKGGAKKSGKGKPAKDVASDEAAVTEKASAETESDDSQDSSDSDDEGSQANRRRRRRGGRRRRRPNGTNPDGTDSSDDSDDAEDSATDADEDSAESSDATRRRRTRSRTRGASSSDESRNDSMRGSTRLEAKKQRRREGRDAGRRRAPILTEAEFLARRENVNRVMVVRQLNDRVQIAVLEDNVLVEHYVNRTTGSSMIGNVYLGRIQNVLPSMEAAFVDIGRGRNAVLYAGEVNWDAAGLDGQSKRIELAFKVGDPVLVQVTKDPIGHKGARLTAQVSLPGRFLVYVPDGSMTGISRKLPEKERNRLKSVLRSVLPEEAGVIVRTAAEGAAEEDLTRDVSRLAAQWEDIAEKVKTANAPALLYSEPDLAIKVVRDIFNEDFNELVVAGDEIWETIEQYVSYVAPDLAPRLKKWVDNQDLFTRYRIDEQLAKALDRKVWLPSGGSLVIDRTEAMTVVDVNTGKFTGEGGNLEQTVTTNNLEAAEEIVRQLRLRDIGGIIVVDFIDMVLESNRDLVLRRLIECLGRDRTKHQVAEVTSLGLVQMTRKRIGQGLLETFSEPCEACHGRGVKVRLDVNAAKTATPAISADEDSHADHAHDHADEHVHEPVTEGEGW